MTITGEQLRAARAFVRIEQTDLAQRAGVSVHTIKRLEATVGVLSADVNMMAPILAALNAAGVEFILESEGGPGVEGSKTLTFQVIAREGDPVATGVFLSLDEVQNLYKLLLQFVGQYTNCKICP